MDAAFKTASYPAYTTRELEDFILDGKDATGKMAAEVDRRNRVKAGDMSVATAGEKLRAASRN